MSSCARELDQARAGAGLSRPSGWSRRSLPPQATLLGFCGAPWTVATYMIAGHGTPDQAPARLFAYREPEAFARADRYAGRSLGRLSGPASFEAGVDAVQIFDTWAGVLPPDEFERWCIAPTRQIVAGLRRANAGREDHRISARRRHAICVRYVERVPVDAVGLDWMIDLTFARDACRKRRRCRAISIRWRCCAGGAALDRGVDAILRGISGGPFIFNLGHGILPDTPIAHVEQMLKRVRG